MSSGAPAVSTNPYYTGYNSNPKQDYEAAVFRGQHIIERIPVYGRNIDYTVPHIYRRNRGGWVASDVPTVPGPTYPTAVEAPAIMYKNKAYDGLIAASAKPVPSPNRRQMNLGAPDIQTTFS